MNEQRGISYKERIPIFIDKEQKEDGTFYCYDGHNYGFISESQLKEFKQFKTVPFIIIIILDIFIIIFYLLIQLSIEYVLDFIFLRDFNTVLLFHKYANDLK